MTPRTIADASEYWDRYYGAEFIFGLGTENILSALQCVPPIQTWIDLGSGSESLLWSAALDADRLIAVDRDEQRLSILRAYAEGRRPRPAYRTVLDLCGRTSDDFAERCERLSGTVTADCFLPSGLPFGPGSVNLLTQFGLLGLTSGPGQFLSAWMTCHESLMPDGWTAGANWSSNRPTGRVQLSHSLYQAAFTQSGITPLYIERVPVSGDPDFDSVWIYLGRHP